MPNAMQKMHSDRTNIFIQATFNACNSQSLQMESITHQYSVYSIRAREFPLAKCADLFYAMHTANWHPVRTNIRELQADQAQHMWAACDAYAKFHSRAPATHHHKHLNECEANRSTPIRLMSMLCTDVLFSYRRSHRVQSMPYGYRAFVTQARGVSAFSMFIYIATASMYRACRQILSMKICCAFSRMWACGEHSRHTARGLSFRNCLYVCVSFFICPSFAHNCR